MKKGSPSELTSVRSEPTPPATRAPILQVAVEKKVSPATLERAIKRGELRVTWHLNRRLVDPSEVDRLISTRRGTR
jgi:hypothetical protein